MNRISVKFQNISMICDSFSGYFQKLNTMNEVVVHRPGPFKHANKRHKTGRHRAKGTVDDENKGKLVYTVVKCVCVQVVLM